MTEPDGFFDKLMCCKNAPKKQEGVKYKVPNGRPKTEQPTWTVAGPLSASNGVEAGTPGRRQHVELTRLTSDVSHLGDPKYEPAEEIDPDVVQEVSHEDLARYSVATPSSSSMTPSPPVEKPAKVEKNPSFTEVDLNAESSPVRPPRRNSMNSPKSIEEVALEYNRSKKQLLKEITKEERRVQRDDSGEETDVSSISDHPPIVEKLKLTEEIPEEKMEHPLVNKEALVMDEPMTESVLSQIEAEFKEIIEELEEESDEELRNNMELRASQKHESIKRSVSTEPAKDVPVVEAEPVKEIVYDIEDKAEATPSSSSPLQSTPAEEQLKQPAHSHISVMPFEDSDEELLLSGNSTERTDISLPPPPVISIPSTPVPPSTAPVSSSSGFATSTMYSAASDDSDVSEGEAVPENKRIFDVSDDEGTFSHDGSAKKKGNTVDDKSRTQLTLDEKGAVTVGDDVVISLNHDKSITVTDDEFSEKLV